VYLQQVQMSFGGGGGGGGGGESGGGGGGRGGEGGESEKEPPSHNSEETRERKAGTETSSFAVLANLGEHRGEGGRFQRIVESTGRKGTAFIWVL